MGLAEYRFRDGEAVRVSYPRRPDLRSHRGVVLGADEERDSYDLRLEDGSRIAVLSEDVYGDCGCALPGYAGGCRAYLTHGPGHQSHTHCRLGQHDDDAHEAVYGDGLFAAWRGERASSGFFDEPPQMEEG